MCTSRLITGSTVCQTLFHSLILFVILAPLPLSAMDEADAFPGSSCCTPDEPVLGRDKYGLRTKEFGIELNLVP